MFTHDNMWRYGLIALMVGLSVIGGLHALNAALEQINSILGAL